MEMNSDSPITSRGYSHVEMLSLEPEPMEIQGNTLIFAMRQPDITHLSQHDVKRLEVPAHLPSHLDETIAKFVAEKRSDLLAVVEGEFSGEQPEIHIHDRGGFNRQISEITANITADGDSEQIQALVTQKCLKELWPVLCLNEGLKRLNQSCEKLGNTTHVIPQGKISKQFKHAVKTTSVFLEKIKEVESLPRAKIEEKAWETQKLLAKNEVLRAKLEQLDTPTNEQVMLKEVKQLEVQVQNLIKEMGGSSQPTGFLGTWLNWVAKAVSTPQPERDRSDFQFLQHYQGKIDALHNRVQVLTDQAALLNPKPSALCKELEKLSKTINEYHDITEYLDDYFVLEEAQQTATLRLTDQMEALQNGRCAFSPEAYIGLVRQVGKFGKIGANHKAHTKNAKLVEEIDKKTVYQTQQGIYLLEDFMEELVPSMQAECDEAIAQWNTAYARWSQEPTADNRNALLEAQIVRQAILKDCTAFYSKIGDANISEKFISQKDLRTVRELQRKLEKQPLAPEEIATEAQVALRGSDISEYLNDLRNERTSIGKAQQHREWHQREFKKLEEEGPPARNLFLHCFFFYLQALTPVVDAFSTPIAKQDYDYCLKMMAKTSQSASPTGESYDDYLAKARSFIGIDHDFLENYDQFLRGQMQFTYNPTPIHATTPEGMIAPGSKTTSEAIHEWVQGVAPNSIADWTASLLGLSPKGQPLPDASAWDLWVQNSIYPQVKDNYFSGIVNYFEQLSPSTPFSTEGDAAVFGHHCYQMYESLKAPDGQEAFQTHLQEARQFPQFSTFLNDFQLHLNEHPPQVQVEVGKIILNESIVAPVSVSSSDPPPFLMSEQVVGPVTSAASKTNELFAVTWAKNIGSFIGSFLNSAQPIDITHHVKETTARELVTLQTHTEVLLDLHAQVDRLHQLHPFLLEEQGRSDNLSELSKQIDSLRILQKDLQKIDVNKISTRGVADFQIAVNEFGKRIEDATEKYNELHIEEQTVALERLRQTIENSSVDISSKTLLHVVGDPFGRDSGLEGHTWAKGPEFRLGLFQAKLKAIHNIADLAALYESVGLKAPEENLEVHSLDKHIKQMQTALDLLLASREGFLSPQLERHLHQAAVGEPILLPSGWVGAPQGHVIYLEFMKQENGLFSLRIYNTGAGVEYHSQHAQEFKTQHVTFMEQVDIPIENLVDPLLCGALQNLQKNPPKSENKWNQNDIYDSILGVVGGTPSKGHYSENDLRTDQRAGTCGFMALATALSYRMESKEAFLKFEFEAELKALVDYVKEVKDNRIQDPGEVVRGLLEKSLAEFSRDVLDFHDRGIINDLEQLYATKHIREIHAYLQELESDHLTASYHQAMVVDLSSLELTPLRMSQNESFREFATELPKNTQVTELISRRGWAPTKETLISDIGNFRTNIEAAANRGDHKTVIKEFSALSEAFPLVFSDDNSDLWNILSENTERVLQSLTQITKTAAMSIAFVHANTLPPKLLLGQAKLFTICHKLGIPSLQHLNLPKSAFISTNWLNYINGNHLYFRTYDPVSDAEIVQLREYWDNWVPDISHTGKSGLLLKNHCIRSLAPPDYNKPEAPPIAQSGDLNWLNSFSKNPEIRDEFARLFPRIKPSNVNWVINAVVLADQIEDDFGNRFKNDRVQEKFKRLLPDTFYLLRDLMVVSHVLTSYEFNESEAKIPPTFDFQFVAEIHYSNEIQTAELILSTEKNDLSEIDRAAHTHNNIDSVLYDSFKSIKNDWLKNSDQLVKEKKWTINSPSLSLEQKRDIRGLVLQPNLQVRETLTYFMLPQNAELLEKSDYQILFSTLLFDPGLLLNELNGDFHDVQHFVGVMNQLVNEKFDLYARVGNWNTAIFFARLGQKFNHYVESCYKDHNWPPPISKDLYSEISTLLNQQPFLPIEAKAKFNLILALEYQKMEKVEDIDSAVKFLGPAILYHYHLNRCPVESGSREDQVELLSLSERFREDLAELTNGPQRSLLLNALMRGVKPSFTDQAWEPYLHFPLFISEDRSVAIDVLDGVLHETMTDQPNLPLWVRSSRNFMNFFGKDFNPVAKSNGKGVYEFTNSAGDKFRVRKTQRQWGPDDIHVTRAFVRDGKEEWYQKLSDFDSLPTEIKNMVYLLPDNSFWVGKQKELLFYPPDASQPNAMLAGGVVTGLTDQNKGLRLARQSVDFLNNFEFATNGLSWLSEDNSLHRFEYPRLNLSFTAKNVQGVSRLYCDTIPGYFLAKTQYVKSLTDYPHYLLLVNSLGQQKLLLTDIPTTQNFGHVSRKSEKTEFGTPPHCRTFYEYSISPSGRVIPSTESSRYYLAKVYLLTMNYSTAMGYLRENSASLRPFEKDEVDILQSILSKDPKAAFYDNDPRAIAIRVYASYLLSKNGQNFPQSPSAGSSASSELMTSYLNLLDKTANINLMTDEELFLLVKNHPTPQEQYRLWHLANEASVNQIVSAPSVPISQPMDKEDISVRVLDPRVFLLDDEVIQVLKSAQVSYHKPSVLMLDINSNFSKLYQLARGDLESSFTDELAEMTNVVFPNLSPEEHRETLTKLLNLVENRVSQDCPKYLVNPMGRRYLNPLYASKVAFVILRAVVKAPETFPKTGWAGNLTENKNEILSAVTSAKIEEDIRTPPERPSVFNPEGAASIDHQKANVEHVVELPFEECVAPYASSILNAPVLQDISSFIEIVDLPITQMNKANEELTEVFNIETPDRVANREFNHIRNDLRTYHERTVKESPPKYYALSDPLALAEVKNNLATQITQGTHLLDSSKIALLEKANKLPTNELDLAKLHLERIGEGEQPIEIDDLVNLFLTGDRDRYHQANDQLTEEEIYNLNHDIMDYLVTATHIQHLKRVTNEIDKIQQAQKDGVSDESLSVMLDGFATAASAVRAYDVELHPQYLVFEYYMEFLIRPEQAANLDLLQIHNGRINNPEQIGVVLEMLMGAGKTAVLLPLLGQLNADGEKLSIGVLPEALLPSMVQELTATLGKSFKQRVEVLDYNRDHRLSSDDLKILHLRLEQIRTGKRMLFMSSSTIQGLYLSFIETWHTYATTNVENGASIEGDLETWRNIFRLFKDHGKVIIDESDLILGVRKEHHFTLGSPQPLDLKYIQLTSFIYGLLDSPDVPKMRFDFGIGNSDAPPFTVEAYRSEVLPVLVEKVLEHKLGSKDSEVQAFFEKLSDQEYDHLHRYLSNTSDDASLAFIQNIPNIHIKDQLALAKEQIQTLIPLTANKILGVNYGPSRSQPIRIAIPYHGNDNPAEPPPSDIKRIGGSRFTEFETLNYTIQQFLATGVTKEEVKTEITQLVQQAAKLDAEKLLESAVYKRFLRLTGSDPRIQIFNAEQWIDEITDSVNRNTSLKLEYAQKLALPEIVSHPLTLSANPQVYNYLFGDVSGFSGTQWAGDTVPQGLGVISSDISIGKTLSLLWARSNENVHVAKSLNGQNFTKNLMAATDSENLYAVIDTAASSKGVSNEIHARNLLALCSTDESSINGVVFYDENNNLMILERGGEIKPFSRTTLAIDERMTIYDQKHTTGSDIKQPFSAVAIVTIGKQTILRDLLQAVWRMRGLAHGQRIEFLMDQEVMDIVTSTLENITGNKFTGPLQLRHVLLFVAYNQAILQGDNNFRTIKQRINGELQKAIFHAVLSNDVPIPALKNLYDEVQSLFVTQNTSSTWDMFGIPQEERASEKVIDALVEKALEGKPFVALTSDPILAPLADSLKVQERIENLAEMSLETLPEKLPFVDRQYGVEAQMETEMEAEKETEKEQETETEVEKERDLSVYDSVIYKWADFQPPQLSDIQTWDYFDELAVDSKQSEGINKLGFISLNQALSNEPSLQEFAGVFDPALMGSLSLIRQADKTILGQSEYALFNYFQKATTDLLIVQNKTTGQLKVVLNDLEGSENFRALLEKDALAEESDGQTRLCIYKPGFGSYRQGKERIDTDVLQKDPHALRLIVQAKFFSGQINYNEAELPVLKEWVLEHGIQKMERLFHQIVNWKLHTRQALSGSSLEEALSAA